MKSNMNSSLGTGASPLSYSLMRGLMTAEHDPLGDCQIETKNKSELSAGRKLKRSGPIGSFGAQQTPVEAIDGGGEATVFGEHLERLWG